MDKDQTKLQGQLVKWANNLVESGKVEKSVSEDVVSSLQEILKDVTTSDFAAGTGTFVERQHLDTQIGDITDRETPFIDRVTTKQANGKTHEWDMITALGSNDTATAEGGIPADNEATITRYSAQIKTYATKVKVTDLAQFASKDYVNLMDTHLAAGMKKILHDVETKVWYGNNGGATPNDISGIYKIVSDLAPGNIISGAGATASSDMVDDAIQKIVDNGGRPTHVYMGAEQLRDFAASYASKVVYNDPGAGMTFGYNVARYMSFAGPVDIVLDPFINDTNSPNGKADIFVVSMPNVAIAQSEPMYKLPPYRGLELAEVQSVVWNIALEVRVPQFMAMITNVNGV